MVWYSTKSPDYVARFDYQENAHGIVNEVILPNDCSAEELIKFLNGNRTETIQEFTIGKLEHNKWTIPHYVQSELPNLEFDNMLTIKQIFNAVLEDLDNG